MANCLRYVLACLMWSWQCSPARRLLIRLLFWPCGVVIGGRHVDWMPMRCEECGWRGPLRWTFHTYEDDGSGEDVTALDECPKCGSPDLEDE
jgi:hypothetical protein